MATIEIKSRSGKKKGESEGPMLARHTLNSSKPQPSCEINFTPTRYFLRPCCAKRSNFAFNDGGASAAIALR
jgi:hypothetical protein